MYNRWSSPNWKSLRFKTKITSIQIFHCSRSQEEVEPEESAAVCVWREPVSVDGTFRPGAGAGGSPSTRSGTSAVLLCHGSGRHQECCGAGGGAGASLSLHSGTCRAACHGGCGGSLVGRQRAAVGGAGKCCGGERDAVAARGEW